MRFTLVALACALMASAPAFADVKSGVEAWTRGDFPTAISAWRPLAIKGDADAQFNLGQAYKLGRGVPQDLKQAQDWYARAADQGHFQAEDNLGLILFQNGDRQKAMSYIERSASRGEPRAQYVLATALFNGDLAKKDWVRAYALMTRASAAGIGPASASLAQMDRFVPLEQRQKGLALARALEDSASRPQFASDITQPSRPAREADPAIRDEDVPSSKPRLPVGPAVKKPVLVAVAKPAPVKLQPQPLTKISGPAWRVQLGAFGDQGNARALWSKLQSRVTALGGLQPNYVKAGAVTRLQAGPIAGKAAAERICAALKSSGQGCLPVAP